MSLHHEDLAALAVVIAAVVATTGPMLVQLRKMKLENRDQHLGVDGKLDRLIETNDATHEKIFRYLIEHFDEHAKADKDSGTE